jgi:hypothetical protein
MSRRIPRWTTTRLRRFEEAATKRWVLPKLHQALSSSQYMRLKCVILQQKLLLLLLLLSKATVVGSRPILTPYEQKEVQCSDRPYFISES